MPDPRPSTTPTEPEENADEIDVTECPDCGQKGVYEQRVLINGRGFYTCPNQHRWQDARETPTTKGAPIRG